MKKLFWVFLFTGLLVLRTNGQVAINQNGSLPDSSAGLDVNFTNRGFLPPRVMLVSADTAAPVINPAAGLLVYNTATSGTAPNEVRPGYYFWKGNRWNPFRVGETDTLFVLRADSTGNAPGNYVTRKALHDSLPDISGLAKKEKRFLTLSGQGIKSDASLVHNSSIFGTDQTAAIQAILNKANDSSSLCIIWDTKVSVLGLRIKGNTEIHVLPGCGAILRNSSNKSLFTNYNITFDSTSVVDKNIVIDGGVWNGNSLGNTELANSTNGIHCIFAFYGVENLTMKNLKEYDAPAYFNHIVNVNHFRMEDFIVSYTGNSTINNDGVNINHSYNGIVRDGYLSTNDDGIAISADDQFCYSLTQTYPYYVNAVGPIKNIIIENIVFDNMRFGVRVLSSSSRIDNVVVRNLSGSTKNYALVIDNYWQAPDRVCNHAWGNIGTIHCENINVATLYESINWVRKASVVINCNAEKLIFKDFKRTDFSNTYPSILVSGSKTNIKNLIIDGYDSYDSTLVNDDVPHIQIDSATVNVLEINRATSNIKNNGIIGSSLVFVKNGGKITQLSLNGIVADRVYNIVNNQSGTISNITANHIVHTNYPVASFRTTPTVPRITLSNYYGSTILSGNFTVQDGDAFGAISQHGISNYIPVFYSTKELYPSGMYTDGTNFGISTAMPDSSFTVAIDTNQTTSTGGGHFQGGLKVDKTISDAAGNSTQWNEAYSWGNHIGLVPYDSLAVFIRNDTNGRDAIAAPILREGILCFVRSNGYTYQYRIDTVGLCAYLPSCGSPEHSYFYFDHVAASNLKRDQPLTCLDSIMYSTGECSAPAGWTITTQWVRFNPILNNQNSINYNDSLLFRRSNTYPDRIYLIQPTDSLWKINISSCLNIKAPNTPVGNYSIYSVDGLNRVTYNATNSGRTNTIAYDAGGAVACLYNLSTNPVPDQLAGHYAFGSNNSQNESHTVGYLLCALNDPSYSAMNSSLYLAYMDNVNGRPGGVYSYQQPNKGVLINRYGMRMPKIPLYDQSDTLSVSSNLFVRKNTGIGTRKCPAKLGVNMASISAGMAGIGAAWDSTYAVFGDASSDHGPGIGIGYDRSTGSGVIACGKPGYTWLRMRWNALSHTLYARTDPMLTVNEWGVIIGSQSLGLVQDSVLTTGSGHFIGGCRADGIISAPGGTSENWNLAYSWGNHAAAGYITGTALQNQVYSKTEADSLFLQKGDTAGTPGNYATPYDLEQKVSRSEIILLCSGTYDSLQMLNPGGFTQMPLGYSSGITIDSAVFIAVGANCHVTIDLWFGSNIMSQGTLMIPGGTEITATGTTKTGSIGSAFIPAGQTVWATIPSGSAIPRRISVFLMGHRS